MTKLDNFHPVYSVLAPAVKTFIERLIPTGNSQMIYMTQREKQLYRYQENVIPIKVKHSILATTVKTYIDIR